jgi:hypothetical protein
MEQCESKVGGACARPATWKHAIHAGQRDQGRILMHAAWCDEHAEKIRQKRRSDWQAPPDMAPLVAETS